MIAKVIVNLAYDVIGGLAEAIKRKVIKM